MKILKNDDEKVILNKAFSAAPSSLISIHPANCYYTLAETTSTSAYNHTSKVKSELEHMGMPVSGDDDELRARLINALCEDTWCNNALGVQDR